MKVCSKCGISKKPSLFYRHKGILRSECILCTKAVNAAWRAANKPKIAEKSARHKKAGLSSKWQLKYYTRNRAKCNAAARNWQEANPQKHAEATAKSNARARDLLTDGYVANKLKMNLKDVPPSLLELKRIQLQIKRHLRGAT